MLYSDVMKAKKSMGQNFLRDQRILRKIVDFAQIEKTDVVVEVGPGEGTLTSLLLQQSNKVIAVEKDEKLAEKLEERFKLEIENSKLAILNGDILDIENLLKIAKLKIENYSLVGNIPYYITGEILRKFLESENQPESLTFVVQKEVADRIMARDGKESVLSISIKAYGEPEYGGIIKAGSFTPAPKVDSAIIAVRNINKKKFKGVSEKTFFEVLKRGFAHKRKFLIKNLGASKALFQELGLSEKARAEDLKVEDWFALAKDLI